MEYAGGAQRGTQPARPAGDGELELVDVAGRVGRRELERVGAFRDRQRQRERAVVRRGPGYGVARLLVANDQRRPTLGPALERDRLAVDHGLVPGGVQADGRLAQVEDPADQRRRLGFASGPDDRDAEVVGPLRQGDGDDRPLAGSRAAPPGWGPAPGPSRRDTRATGDPGHPPGRSGRSRSGRPIPGSCRARSAPRCWAPGSSRPAWPRGPVSPSRRR